MLLLREISYLFNRLDVLSSDSTESFVQSFSKRYNYKNYRVLMAILILLLTLRRTLKEIHYNNNFVVLAYLLTIVLHTVINYDSDLKMLAETLARWRKSFFKGSPNLRGP